MADLVREGTPYPLRRPRIKGKVYYNILRFALSFEIRHITDISGCPVHSDSAGKIFRAEGTVSVKTKDTPGKCFADANYASLVPGLDPRIYVASMAEVMTLQAQANTILANLVRTSLTGGDVAHELLLGREG